MSCKRTDIEGVKKAAGVSVKVTSRSLCGSQVARSGLVELSHVTGSGLSSPTSFQLETSSDATPRTFFHRATEKSLFQE